MQSVIVRIQGDYSDAYLYMRRLFLLRHSGELVVVDWDALVEELGERHGEESIALRWALGQNQVLYSRGISPYLDSPTLRRAFSSLIRRLATQPHDVDSATLRRHLWYEGDICGDEITDIHLYMKRIYFSARSGTYTAELLPGRKRNRIGDPVRIHDVEALGFAAYWRTIYLCAGDDGLYGRQERPPEAEDWNESRPWCRLGRATSLRAYNNLGDVANVTLDHRLSYLGRSRDIIHGRLHGTTRSSSWETRERGPDSEPPSVEELQELDFWELSNQDPFEYSDVAASREKVFLRVRGDFHSYLRWSEEQCFQDVGRRSYEGVGEALDIAVGDFGLLLDLHNCVCVLDDDGVSEIASAPSSRCRTFPQSRFYQNMFLTVQDDHVIVGSALDDMLRDQRSKVLGLYGSARRPEEPRTRR